MLDLRELSSDGAFVSCGGVIYRLELQFFPPECANSTELSQIITGEVIVWDLTNPETPLAISPIIEYSHKEPVQDLKW